MAHSLFYYIDYITALVKEAEARGKHHFAYSTTSPRRLTQYSVAQEPQGLCNYL